MKYSISHGATIVLLGKDLKDDFLARFLGEPGVSLRTASFRFEISLSDGSKVEPEIVVHAAQPPGMATDRWSLIFTGCSPSAWWRRGACVRRLARCALPPCSCELD